MISQETTYNSERDENQHGNKGHIHCRYNRHCDNQFGHKTMCVKMDNFQNITKTGVWGSLQGNYAMG